MRSRNYQKKCVFIIAVYLLGPAAGACHAQEVTLSVMTFNIRYGSADDGPNAWEHRKETVANAIRAYAPDIVGTQECLQFQAQFLDNALPDYEHFGVGRNADGSGERMEVFYKTEELAAIDTGNFWLSKTPEIPGSRDWESANIRMVTWAKFHHLKSQRFFYYLNTHFDHRSEEARRQAARVLARWLGTLPQKTPVIVGGDFNSDAESSEPWHILTGAGLEDAWITAGETKGPEVTWSAFQSPSDSVNRIDWLLYRGSFFVKHCETVLYNENGRYPSDHYPVYSRFVFGK